MGMHYSPKNAIGFQIDEQVAEEMGLLTEYKLWVDKSDEGPFFKAFSEKFKPPSNDAQVMTFEEERGGEIQGVSGFSSGATYVYWQDVKRSEKGWRPFIKKMEGKVLGLYFEDGKWSQLV